MRRDSLDSTAHLGRRPSRERQEHHPTGICALDDQVSHSMGKRVCFTSPSSRDDQQRLITAVLHSSALFGIERFKKGLHESVENKIFDSTMLADGEGTRKSVKIYGQKCIRACAAASLNGIRAG